MAKFQCVGHPNGIPDAETRRELYYYTNTNVPDDDDNETAPLPKLDMKALLTEAVTDDSSTPVTPVQTKRGLKDTRNPLPPATDGYDPTAPQLALPEFLRKIRENERVRAERDATTVYEHNPHLIEHIFSNAPYTFSLCKRCKRNRRKCHLHRQIFQQQTSISLCTHVFMNLHWAVNDPCNDRCSWKIEIKEYFGESRSTRSREREYWDRREHERCKMCKPSERVEELAGRVFSDMRKERKPLRANCRRIAAEIHALLGAWERAMALRLEEQARKAKVEEEVSKAHEQLAETLRVVRVMQEKETQQKRKPSVEESEILESVETLDPEVSGDGIQALEIQHMPLQTCSPTPELPKSIDTTPERAKSPSPATPEPNSRRRSSASNKRKRSVSVTLSPPPKKPKTVKKVRWALEIEASEDVERPRIVSSPRRYVPYEGQLSPIAVGRDIEDEVDWDDDELD